MAWQLQTKTAAGLLPSTSLDVRSRLSMLRTGLPMAHFGEGRRFDVQLTNSLRQIIRQPTSTLTAASITLFLKKHSGFLLCLITMLQLGSHQLLQDYLPIIQSPESHGIRVRCRIVQSGLHALSTKKGRVIK